MGDSSIETKVLPGAICLPGSSLRIKAFMANADDASFAARAVPRKKAFVKDGLPAADLSFGELVDSTRKSLYRRAALHQTGVWTG